MVITVERKSKTSANLHGSYGLNSARGQGTCAGFLPVTAKIPRLFKLESNIRLKEIADGRIGTDFSHTAGEDIGAWRVATGLRTWF